MSHGNTHFVPVRILPGPCHHHAVREDSRSYRNAIHLTLEIAILFGSITAGNAMAGGVGIALVGGIYALNEVLGRPVVRMAAGPVAVILAGIIQSP